MDPAVADTSSASRAFEALLGADLCALLNASGVQLAEAVPITTVPSARAHRASFRLTLSDGTVLKGRRVNDLVVGDRIHVLSALLDPTHYSRPIARWGRAFLEPWIVGVPLANDGSDAARLEACGRLHAALHRLTPPEAPFLRRPPSDWAPHLDGLLAELVTGNVLPLAVAREVERLAGLHAPAATDVRVCHTDFCAENIVVDDTGAIVVVDNENITVAAAEYDLARTWYRWPMTGGQVEAYLAGYGGHGHTSSFAHHFLHWALIVLVESIAFRSRATAAAVTVPLERLATLLRSGADGEAMPRLLGRR